MSGNGNDVYNLADGWLELDSDPGLFTLLLQDFGVQGVQVRDDIHNIIAFTIKRSKVFIIYSKKLINVMRESSTKLSNDPTGQIQIRSCVA